MTKILFEAVCPIGCSIALDRDCWHGHILNKRYLRMHKEQGKVRQTIEAPDLIYENRRHGRVNYLYWKEFPEIKAPDKWLKVATWIVDSKNQKGIVTTAHFAMFPKGGDVIWQK